MTYTTYPTELKDEHLFYVEFISDSGGKAERWRLFKRNFYCSKEEWEESERYAVDFCMRELHPYQLANGEVYPGPNPNLYSKKYLHLLVDSLNSYQDLK